MWKHTSLRALMSQLLQSPWKRPNVASLWFGNLRTRSCGLVQHQEHDTQTHTHTQCCAHTHFNSDCHRQSVIIWPWSLTSVLWHRVLLLVVICVRSLHMASLTPAFHAPHFEISQFILTYLSMCISSQKQAVSLLLAWFLCCLSLWWYFCYHALVSSFCQAICKQSVWGLLLKNWL